MEENVKKQLKDLVLAYGDNKQVFNDLKTICDNQNAEIKKIMEQNNLDDITAGEYTAVYKVKQNIDVNEDRMLYLLIKADEKKFRELGIIRSKDYIDSDILEKSIYYGLIDKDLLAELNKCSTPKPVPTLTIKKKGKK